MAAGPRGVGLAAALPCDGPGPGQQPVRADAAPPPPPTDPNARFDRSSGDSENRFAAAGLSAQWQTRIGKEGKLDSSASLRRTRNDFARLLREFLGPTQVRLLDDNSITQDRHCLQDGQPCLLDFGDQLRAGTRRFAAFAQDEWSVGKQWSFYAGLRGETIRTESRAGSHGVGNTSTVFTPLLHGLYKLSDDPRKSRDQIRMSLTRSYRSPELNDMIARPNISALRPCPAGAL